MQLKVCWLTYLAVIFHNVCKYILCGPNQERRRTEKVSRIKINTDKLTRLNYMSKISCCRIPMHNGLFNINLI